MVDGHGLVTPVLGIMFCMAFLSDLLPLAHFVF